ncbi:MAG TPA: hypothetical protein VG013_37000 [Gemmataceae bacterium]|nr:hypothetical protein [Gemmataceae bacterium]
MSKAAGPAPPPSPAPNGKAPYVAPFPVQVLAFLMMFSLMPLVSAFIVGSIQVAEWLYSWRYSGATSSGYIQAFVCHLYMIAMPFMTQALATKQEKDFDPRHRAYATIMWGFYWGSFLGCVVLFSYYSRRIYLLTPEAYAGHVGPGYGPWLLYCFNNFFDAILLGAPSTLQFEISDIHPESFSGRLSLYLFRLMTVAGLLSTARIIWKRHRGQKVSDDEVHALAKKFRDNL